MQRLATGWRDAISTLIRELRLRKNWTQEELGHRSGYDPGYINMLERGKRNPSVQALINICQALDVQPSQFYFEIEQRLRLIPQRHKIGSEKIRSDHKH